MPLDKETMQYLQAQSITAQSFKLFTDTNQAPVSAIPIDSGMKIADLEKYMPAPCRFRGGFETRYLDMFAEYVSDQDGNPSVFIDPDQLSAKAFFDIGNPSKPGHGDHTATLRLKLSAHMQAINDICDTRNGGRVSQREMAEWMEVWKEDLTAEDEDGTGIEIEDAIIGVRDITVESARKVQASAQNLSAERSDMESIEVRGSDKKFPAFLVMLKPSHYGMYARELRIRLSVSLTGDAIDGVNGRMVGWEKIREDVSLELQEKLKRHESLTGLDMVYIGTFNK